MIQDPSNQINLMAHQYLFIELKNLYLKNLLPNKILLSGEKGIGKCTMAYHLINFILSTNEEYSYDINNFKINLNNTSYKLIENNSNPNFILIDVTEEKKNIDINQIRNLILTLNKSSFNQKPRFVLIDNIELLNINSINALLKILEEPNDNINFILINNNKKILPTLKSRCINFKVTLSLSQSVEIINNILNKNINHLLHNELINNYSTPGQILRMIDFAIKSDIELKNVNLKDLILLIIIDKKYKKEIFIKDLLYSLIEQYFRINVSINDITLINTYNDFIKKIHQTKEYNLDEESLLIDFDKRVLNG